MTEEKSRECKTLILVRHGLLASQHRHRFIGSTDLPLAREGGQQAEALAEVLAGLHAIHPSGVPETGAQPLRVLCSPLRRARETAEVVARRLGLEIEIDPDLREIDFGQWEGLTFEEILALDPHRVNQWAEYNPAFSFPGGEALGDFQARVRRAADRMASEPSETLLAFTHGGVIRAMICYLLGLQFRQYLLFDIRPASLTTLQLFHHKGVLTEIRSLDPGNRRDQGYPSNPGSQRVLDPMRGDTEEKNGSPSLLTACTGEGGGG